MLKLDVRPSVGAARSRMVRVDRLVIAGWAGRDAAALRHHIDELAALGVAPPSRTPLFYEAAAALLTQDERIAVVGQHSSGEAEPFVVQSSDGLLVGLGSDHTDRQAEAWSIPHSKQLCAKPVGSRFWRYDDLAKHWDEVVLRSWIPEPEGGWTLYQEGTAGALRSPADLISLKGSLAEGEALFCGTLAAIGGIRAATGFRCELYDPVFERTISCRYSVDCLPIVT